MPLPALTFTPSDSVDDYLVQFPDVGPWLTARGISLAQLSGENEVRWWNLRADSQGMLEQIALQFSRPRWEETTDWAQESLSDLVHHLIDIHHAFCRAELPRLRWPEPLLARDICRAPAARLTVSDSHARAQRWASAISLAVISSAISARHSWPRLEPFKAARLNHLCASMRSTSMPAVPVE